MAQEFEFIRWVRQQLGAQPEVLIGPGDDCAMVAPGSHPWLMTTDTLTEGVDFLLESATAEAIGRKAMAVNLSDIAAMAGRPRYALVSVVTRPELGPGFLQALFRGLHAVASEFQTVIIGGDTNSWAGGLVVTVTLLGEATANGAVRRNGAQVGDWIFVTGPCGGSLLGRHLDPRPRVPEALALNDQYDLHAMIDISDGLATDLRHITTESGVGAVLFANQIPIHPDALLRANQTDLTPLDHALNDGEDFELIFTLPAAEGRRLQADSRWQQLHHIGEITARGLLLQTKAGLLEELRITGWEHEV